MSESVQRVDEVSRVLEELEGIGSPGVVRGVAAAEVRRVFRFLKQLAGGEARYDGEDRDWLLALVDSSTSSIDATSTPGVDGDGLEFEDGFWTTDFGKRYLSAQSRAVRRGVSVRRLFVLERPEIANTPGFLDLLHSQLMVGVEVRLLDSDLPTSAQRDALIDFILFDRTASYELIPEPQGARSAPSFIETRLITRPHHTAHRTQLFDELWAVSSPLG